MRYSIILFVIVCISFSYEAVNAQGENSANSKENSASSSGGQRDRIDVKSRLAAIYKRFPDLEIAFREADHDLNPIYEDLFTEKKSKKLYKEMEVMDGMISRKHPWHTEQARNFLVQNQ